MSYLLSNYIEQQFQKAIVSEVFYLQSTNRTGTPADGIASIQLDQQEAIAVITHHLFWVPKEGGGTITFFDQFGFPLYSQLSSNAGVGTWAPIVQLIKGSTIKVSCSDIATTFTVSYQYLMGEGRKES